MVGLLKLTRLSQKTEKFWLYHRKYKHSENYINFSTYKQKRFYCDTKLKLTKIVSKCTSIPWGGSPGYMYLSTLFYLITLYAAFCLSPKIPTFHAVSPHSSPGVRTNSASLFWTIYNAEMSLLALTHLTFFQVSRTNLFC